MLFLHFRIISNRVNDLGFDNDVMKAYVESDLYNANMVI